MPTPGSRFRAAVTAEKPLQVAGAINAYAALLAKQAGFRALYLSGAGVANHSYGLPDIGKTELADVLIDAVTVAGHEPLAGVPDLVEPLDQVGARLLGRGGGLDQQVAFVGERHAERVDLAAAGPAGLAGAGGHQVDRRAGHGRAGRGDLGGAPPGGPGGGVGDVGHRVETPARTDQGADAEAGTLVGAQVFDVAVAGAHRFGAPHHDPGVGIACAGVQGGLNRRVRLIEVAHAPTLWDRYDKLTLVAAHDDRRMSTLAEAHGYRVAIPGAEDLPAVLRLRHQTLTAEFGPQASSGMGDRDVDEFDDHSDEPGYDPAADVAVFYVLLDLQRMNPRYCRYFLRTPAV